MDGADGRVLGERYTLRAEIGRGAMGVVWLGTDELLHRDVAVKQLLLPAELSQNQAQDARARALREARIAARLQHPNAVSVYDVVIADGQPWLVMEYLPSASLAAILAERGVLDPGEAARIGASAAAALAAAHQVGIVHRDIKPGNILLAEDGTVKITDFGIARATGDVALTGTGMLPGTPAYLAPEIAKGSPPAPTADLFSLGATLYAAVEGDPPFGRTDNGLAMLHRVANGQITPPVRAGELTGVLNALLALDPAARPTAAQAADLLAAVATGTPPDESLTELILGWSPPAGQIWHTVPPTARTRRRWPLIALAIGAALAIPAAAIVLALTSGGDQPGDEPGGTAANQPPVPNSDTGTSGGGTPTTTTTTRTPAPTTTTTSSTTTRTTRPDEPEVGHAQVSSFVTDHYAALPGDTRTAWNNLTPDNRMSYAEYDRFWSRFATVRLDGVPDVSGTGSSFTVHVRIQFDSPDGTNSVEPYRLRVVAGDDDRLLIASATAVS